MSKHKITSKNIKNIKNIKIINEFVKLVDQIKYDMDHTVLDKEIIRHSYRLMQIKKIINILKKYSKEIKSGEQLKDIKGIGKGTIDRINEIIKKGHLKEIKLQSKYKKYLKNIEELEQIIGIGRKTAYEFVIKHNIKSISDLKKAYKQKKIELNKQILLGLKYHNVYKQIIPRKEILKIDKYLHKMAANIDPELFIIITGSYRRKKMYSNDIDILLTHPKIKTQRDIKKLHNYMIEFINKLKKHKFIVDDLTYENYKTKYMGFCKYKSYPIRRIDIRYVPDNSYYTALVYFTGSKSLNIKLRNIAIELNYKLNEYGLYKKKNNRYIKMKIDSENDIFEKLGLEYIPPEFR
uniref:DNA-directed DNA polymerase n=1 Tax=Mimivirus LCMiAC02 TaxID=2506609 RepID=A0A481Z3F7_9VIRU|nr:MAG: DNA polymerase family X [Mimivirus LCMiAC02]